MWIESMGHLFLEFYAQTLDLFILKTPKGAVHKYWNPVQMYELSVYIKRLQNAQKAKERETSSKYMLSIWLSGNSSQLT